MIENIKKTLEDLIVPLQMAKLYGIEHPKFRASIDKAYDTLQDVFKDRAELVIGVISGELAFEKEIFFELSKIMRPMLDCLKERDIERIAFNHKMQKEELSRFIIFLTSPKDHILKKDPGQELIHRGIRNINAGKIGVPSSLESGQRELASCLTLYNDSLDKFSKTIETVLNDEAIDYFNVKFTVNNLIENLISRYQELLKLATIKRYDIGTFAHILNVSILSMYFSSKLGFSKDDISQIGLAALFHDIGKLYISRKIITKPARLTDEEFTKIKSHVVLGAEILLKYVDTLGILPVIVSFEHHLKYDLKGYPKLTVPQRPHMASLIVSICDVYDALSQRRSYKNDYPPDMIYDIMFKDKGSAFDPGLIDDFFRIMGVWPIGSIVSLSDARVAAVREENENDIFSPKVEIIGPEGKKELLDLTETKGTIAIAHYLNPFNEGKAYLNLI